MRSFAPNVYVLEYLMNTNQLTGANERDAYRFIQSGTLTGNLLWLSLGAIFQFKELAVLLFLLLYQIFPR